MSIPFQTGGIGKCFLGDKIVAVGGCTQQEYKTTVACDFRSGASGELTTISELLTNDRLWWNHSNAKSQGSNGTLRLSIPSTDKSAGICLGGGYSGDSGGITNGGHSATTTWAQGRKQNLVKKAYLKISNVYISGQYSGVNYGTYGAKGPYINFQKKLLSSNFTGYRGEETYVSRGGFTFRTSSGSSWSTYALPAPNDPNVQYLALPSTPNVGVGVTCSDYIDQGTSCLYSRLTIETRGTDPSDFHYRIIVEATGNEYDCGLCTDLGPISIEVSSGDWWCSGSYKEISEAYIEFFDDLYIIPDGSIVTEKPR